MWRRHLLSALLLFLAAGCQRHAFTDYRPLDQAGMWYGRMEDLRSLNTSDAEVAQLVRLKQAGAPDDLCVNLISVSHRHQHPFMSTDAVINLSRAGFTDQDILGIAQQDKLDTVSGDAVTLRLTGLSNSVVLAILNRQQRGRRTMSGPQIAELMNTGLTENQILERINRGMTDAEADREIAARKRARNQTGFKRNYGRRRY